MDFLFYFVLIYSVAILIISVNSAVIPNSLDVDQQGLYSKSDNVEILTKQNFDTKVYRQNHSLLIQFYNSYCGHCRAFYPKYKALGSQIKRWKNHFRLAVLDCSVEENNEICRQFEVMAYPSLRYIHEGYEKGNSKVGEKLQLGESAEKLKELIIAKLQNEQSMGRFKTAPSLNIASYNSYVTALSDIPQFVKYTFLVFENGNSTVGSELALDLSDYENVKVKRVYDTSELANVAAIQQFPGLIALDSKSQPTLLAQKKHTKEYLLKSIDSYLKLKNYQFPVDQVSNEEIDTNEHSEENPLETSDVVYYSDLEKTLKTSIHTEITRHKTLSGEPLQALLDYLEVLITSFPHRGNLKEFLIELRGTLVARNSWSGSDIYDIVKRLENDHSPVYTTNLEYIGCKGSEPKYRGYTCGVWTLFHTLTVNAVGKPDTEGPKILKAMHGYVKHFFGCTECSEHFQAMAARNRIFDVKENYKAILWLWISHNEVNLRLAGDITEDPKYPKIQYPSSTKCPGCRLSRGAWNLPAVYEYLQKTYGSSNIKDARRGRSATAMPSTFSNLDIGMLSLLHMTG